MVNTCAYHLDVYKQIESGIRPRKSTILTSAGKLLTVDYLSIIKKDFRAITSLSKKYKRIGLLHQGLMDEMEEILKRNFDDNGSSSSSNNSELNTGLTTPPENIPTLPTATNTTTNATSTGLKNNSNNTNNQSQLSQNDMFLSSILTYIENITKNMKENPPQMEEDNVSFENFF